MSARMVFKGIAVAVLAARCILSGHVFAQQERVSDGLLALYTFDAVENSVIADQSNHAEPLNLRVASPQGATFRSGRLIVSSSTTIASDGSATKIASVARATNALTIEAWLQPHGTDQTGPARIVSFSADPSQRNFTLGQDGSRYDVRLRTSATNDNGVPSITTPDGSVTTELAHVVFTRAADGVARIFINGQTILETTTAGAFSNWRDDFRLVIANEMTGDRPWLGEFYLVAIYGRALSNDEVQQNFQVGAPGRIDYAALLPPAHASRVDFVKDIQPIFRTHCYDCHSADQEDGGVNLGIRQRALQGGNNGPIFVAGDSANSRLVHLVAAIDPNLVMPPESDGLSSEEVGLLRAWIDQGVPWPDGTDVPDPRVERAKSHWAFQPLRAIPEPPVAGGPWCRTPVDRFILAQLESAGINPQPRTDPRRLIRRITLNLIGLPPTPEEVDAFCAAAGEDYDAATAELVDRLLQSPHYGERWGRHWLDVARYADSDGQESDRDRPTAYHYRDFVIRAFNDDMPYDQFVRWQLAGDEYEPENPQAVAATGFLAAGPFAALPDKLMEDELLRNRYNELDDILSTIGTGLLGLTLGCVRCHDHKYDAIPARDYYGMLSAFHGLQRAEVPLGSTGETMLAYRDSGSEPVPTWLFQRGNYYDRDQPISLGFVSILTNGTSPEEYWNEARAESSNANSTKQRRALAEWMTDVDHGAGALSARVMVNRIWQHHFGYGLVRTPGDFGVRSDAPSHPELLEWLANDFVEHGWRVKRLQRMIVCSAVYQQESAGPVPSDPENRLLSRMPLQRLESEILRDSMLAVSGTLNRTSYGPAVKPPIASEAIVARNLTDDYPADIQDGPEVRRRSVYLFHKRVVPYPFLLAFDKPDAQQSCSRRDRTTVAPQALALLNDRFARTVAADFADRLLEECDPSEPAEWVRRGYRLALARWPEEDELRAATEFIAAQIRERAHREADAASAQRDAVTDFCQVLFSLNEFLYVD